MFIYMCVFTQLLIINIEYKMTNYIGTITSNILDGFIKELKKDKIKEKIMSEIINPILTELSKKYYPYLISIGIMMFVLIIMVFYVVLKALH